MQRRTLAIALVAAGAAALATSLAFDTAREPGDAPAIAARAETEDEAFDGSSQVVHPTAAAPAAPAPPASLRDTEIDGALSLDADGRFAPDRGALALFEYFLSASGEEPAPALRARIVAEIARRLPPEPARDAETFLDRHLAYREAVRRLAEDDRAAFGSDLERRLQWLRELRREFFGAALAERLFGDEERGDAIALERRRIAADPDLTIEQKHERIDALEAELPDALQRARTEAVLPLRLQREEAALRESGADAAAIRALRERSVGVEAADRLAALDARRAAWQQRVAAYRAERASIAEDGALAEDEREALLAALRARHFDAAEQLRVRALDEMEGTP